MEVVSGPWDRERIEDFLTTATIPMRLAAVSGGGWPVVVSLWYVYAEGALWCATQESARIVQHLKGNPRCGFEVAPNEPPYRGVRGRGVVRFDTVRGREMIERLIDRYLQSRESRLARWLIERSADEVALRIDDLVVSSWDYTRRMSDVS